MGLPEKPYTLKALAGKWRMSEDALVYWGAEGKLIFAMKFAGFLGEEAHLGGKKITEGKYCFLSQILTLETAIIRLIMVHGESPIYFMVSGYMYSPIDPPINTNTVLHRGGSKVTKADLVVSASTVKAMEAKHPELLSHGGIEAQPSGITQTIGDKESVGQGNDRPLEGKQDMAGALKIHINSLDNLIKAAKKSRKPEKKCPIIMEKRPYTVLEEELKTWYAAMKK